MSRRFDFGAAVRRSDRIVFRTIGVAAYFTAKGQTDRREATVDTIYHNDLRIQDDYGNFVGTYGGRADGLTVDSHFLEFQRSEVDDKQSGAIIETLDINMNVTGRYRLEQIAALDEFSVTYSVIRL